MQRLCDPQSNVSAHYVIDLDGTIYQLIAEEYRAWHAGVSFWGDITDINSASIGIELVNCGHEFGYTDFPVPQIDSFCILLADIYNRYNMPPSALVGHSDIAPTRKLDPGEKFPWSLLIQRKLSILPDFIKEIPGTPKNLNPQQTTDLLQKLSHFGYDITDKNAAIMAFYRRFGCLSPIMHNL